MKGVDSEKEKGSGSVSDNYLGGESWLNLNHIELVVIAAGDNLCQNSFDHRCSSLGNLEGESRRWRSQRISNISNIMAIRRYGQNFS